MVSHIALLRAVNVGGATVSMDFLKKLALQQRWTDVATHLNSGNLLFSAPGLAAAEAAEAISSGIEAEVGRPVPVLIRTPTQLVTVLERSIRHFPEPSDQAVHIGFLDSAPSGKDVGSFEAEEYVVDGSEIHLHYPNGLGRSKLTNAVMERKLGAVVTVRGRRTVQALIKKSGIS